MAYRTDENGNVVEDDTLDPLLYGEESEEDFYAHEDEGDW